MATKAKRPKAAKIKAKPPEHSAAFRQELTASVVRVLRKMGARSAASGTSSRSSVAGGQ
jgi:hypothetical protein